MGGGASCSSGRGSVSEPDAIAFSAGKAKDYKDSCKEVWITDEISVLVAKFGGTFYATGSKCPHYGAPLSKGVFVNGRIKCPWHGACFDIKTGDIEDFPGLDCIPTYEVKKKFGEVFVYVNPKRFVNKVVRPLTKMSDEYDHLIIFGTGPGGYMCAQTLRQEGYVGKITMITKDPYLPYDRPKLSKALGSEWNDIKLRDKKFFDECDIEVLTNTKLGRLDLLEHKIYLETDDIHEFMHYDKIVLACGLLPRMYSPTVVGYDLKNILQCTTLEESMYIHKMIPGKDVVIVGSSFVAMELASSIKDKVKSLNIISRYDVPFSVVFGAKAGEALLKHFLSKAKNATFHPTDEVKLFQGNGNGEVVGVVTMKKTVLRCDVVIVAIGGTPNTEIFGPDSIKLHKKEKTILVNKHMRTSYKYTWAVGDIVNFPLNIGARSRVSIGHWQVALTHGKVAALNILDREVSIMGLIPFFWTSLCGVNLRYTGYGEAYDESLIYGNMEKMEFCVLYTRFKKAIAFLAVGCDPLASEMAAAFETQADWDEDIPEFITQRFPDPPLVGEIFHGYRPKDDSYGQFDAEGLGVSPENPPPIRPIPPEKIDILPDYDDVELPTGREALEKLLLLKKLIAERRGRVLDQKLAEARETMENYVWYEAAMSKLIAETQRIRTTPKARPVLPAPPPRTNFRVRVAADPDAPADPGRTKSRVTFKGTVNALHPDGREEATMGNVLELPKPAHVHRKHRKHKKKKKHHRKHKNKDE